MALLTNSLRDRKQRPGWAGQPIRAPDGPVDYITRIKERRNAQLDYVSARS